MSRISILLLFITLSLSGFSQSINTIVRDSVRNRSVMVDFIDRQGLQTGEFAESYASEYPAYLPEVGIIEELKKAMVDIQIVVIMATWCGDSKEQIPRFLKVLDQVGVSDDRCSMIGVDSQKLARDLDVTVYGVTRVPTFIIYKHEIEIGRIIETPKTTLEKDLLEICRRPAKAQHEF